MPILFVSCSLLVLLCMWLPVAVNRPIVVKANTKDRSVYAVQDGVRHLIPDWTTFVSMGYDISNIKTMTLKEIEAIPLGEPLKYIVEETVHNPLAGCPCLSNLAYEQSLKPHEHKKHSVCFVKNREAEQLLQKYDGSKLRIHHRMVEVNASQVFHFGKEVNKTKEVEGCDVVIRLLSEVPKVDKYVCPELCVPVPYHELPVSWLMEQQKPKNASRSVTCSMSLDELWEDSPLSRHHGGMNHTDSSNSISNSSSNSHIKGRSKGKGKGTGVAYTGDHEHTSLDLMLEAIARRRVEECNERPLWPGKPTDPPSVKPRKVFGLILWVGSRSRYDYLLQQIDSVRDQPLDPEERIVGWMASEDQYDCKPGSTLCEEIDQYMYYYEGMPATRLNFAAAGWACAQRRVLRALAHVLLLYDPQFVVVGDDDTFVSAEMLSSGTKLNKYLREELATKNVAIGSLTAGRKVTKKGFYYGGAGYLFGRPVIESFNSYKLDGPKERSDLMRTDQMMFGLSVLKQAVVQSEKKCPECVKLTPGSVVGEVGASANISVRVIDMCVNLMSQEHTCFHSDHAMTRCLLYGANAYPLYVGCLTGSKLTDGLFVAMCMGSDVCYPDQHLTCHHFFHNISSPKVPSYQYAAYV